MFEWDQSDYSDRAMRDEKLNMNTLGEIVGKRYRHYYMVFRESDVILTILLEVSLHLTIPLQS